MNYIANIDTIIFDSKFNDELDIGLISAYTKLIFSDYELNDKLFEYYTKDYFYDFIDDGWDVHLYETQFYTNIEIIKNFVKNFNSEEVFNKISPLLSSIKDEFTQDGFNTHYQILFNGVSQCENNPITHKNDIYVYKGDWDDELSKYKTKEQLSVMIRFYFI